VDIQPRLLFRYFPMLSLACPVKIGSPDTTQIASIKPPVLVNGLGRWFRIL
jgi:hypothetical protein